MALLDHLGRPIDLSKLVGEVATPSMSGVRQPTFAQVSGLTPERLGAMVLAVDQGDATEYLSLAEQMEMADLHYSAVLRTRKLAVGRLTAAIEAASDEPRDVEIAGAVRRLTKSHAFREMIADLLDALGKGYSVVELGWDKSGKRWAPKSYTWRDPRWFQFDRATLTELRLRDDDDPANGLALQPYKFAVHYPRLKTGLAIRGGLARLVAVAHMCKSYALKDWLVFAEVFGMPIRVGKYGAGATAEQKATLLRAITNIGTDAAAIIPEGMLIEFIQAQSAAGGDKLFAGLADYLDAQVSIGVLGQTMTTTDGASRAQAEVHNAVRTDIRDDDAIKLAATIDRDIVRPFVDLNWGPPADEAYPTMRLFEPTQEDLEKLSRAITPFVDRGMRVGASVIRDKFGIEEPSADEEVLKPQGGPTPLAPMSDAAPEDNLARERRDARVVLTRRVLAGDTLTADQRALLAATDEQDEIDRLTAEAVGDKWRKVMDPMTDPILALAEKAESFEEFVKELDALELDKAEFTKALATMTMIARGRGDASDEL